MIRGLVVESDVGAINDGVAAAGEGLVRDDSVDVVAAADRVPARVAPRTVPGEGDNGKELLLSLRRVGCGEARLASPRAP